MSNTRAVKIMVPNGQIATIQGWVDQGMYSSITAFCMTAVEKEIERQIELRIKQNQMSSAPDYVSGSEKENR